jgi:hypothetical protein
MTAIYVFFAFYLAMDIVVLVLTIFNIFASTGWFCKLDAFTALFFMGLECGLLQGACEYCQ